jgi:hypothetical protein
MDDKKPPTTRLPAPDYQTGCHVASFTAVDLTAS